MPVISDYYECTRAMVTFAPVLTYFLQNQSCSYWNLVKQSVCHPRCCVPELLREQVLQGRILVLLDLA